MLTQHFEMNTFDVSWRHGLTTNQVNLDAIVAAAKPKRVPLFPRRLA
jgi:hypothetical protein